MSGDGVSGRIYGMLLRMYPARFRRRYEAELRDTFGRRRAIERDRSGWLGGATFALRACADVPLSALRVRLRSSFADDLRYARRSLLRSPAFTLTAVAILAMGIGAGVSVFSVLQAVVLAPLPYAAPDRLVTIWALNISQQLPDGTSWPTVQDWRARSENLRDVASYYRTPFTQRTLTGVGKPLRLQSGAVSPNFFELLGVEPLLGRVFREEENTDTSRVALISHRLWQQRFGGADDVVGKTIELDAETVEIIGVMPRSIRLPTPDTDIWEPVFRFLIEDQPQNRRWDTLVALGRLDDGVTVDAARAELTTISAALRAEYPEELTGLGALLKPLSEEVMGASLPRSMWFLFAAVLCVLLVACTNVANLVMARGLDRAHEFAVRTALGADRWRLVRQLLVENAGLSAAGAVLGVVLSVAGVRMLVALAPPDTPRLGEVALQPMVAAAAVVGALLLGPAFGLPAALWTARRVPEGVLKSSVRSSDDRGQRRFRGVLVVGEVALAIVLMSFALLLVRSLDNVWAVNPGFDPERTLIMRVDLLSSRYGEEGQVAEFYRTAIEEVRAVPGVESAGAITDVFRSRIPDATISLEGEEPPAADVLRPPLITDWVVPGYFEAVGQLLLSGRFFEDHELGISARTDAGVIIVNETMAKTFWPGEDPVGKRLQWGKPSPDKPWLTVVGVVGDTRGGALDAPPIANAYTPFASRRMQLVVRAGADPASLVPSIEAAVRAIDPDVPLSDIVTASDWYADSIAQRRFQTLVLALFALAAIVLAATGIYGVMHDSVARRRREIGIRMAVGADAGQVLRMVLVEGLALAAIGLALGIGTALALGRVVAGFLYEVSPTDPLTLSAAATALIGVAMLATSIPALRATRVDPTETLHE